MMEPVRWGQLSYGSFDSGLSGSGGWQVKQTTGALTEVETERVKARVVTSFEPVGPLPQFPTPDEVALLPRRLAYLPLEATESHAYWHAVPAGTDGTGRPGNVFTHVLVDRATPTAEPAIRPIDLWRSEFWVSPFGQREVADAKLEEPPAVRAGVAITAESVIDFLLEPTAWRTATLSVLLDAIVAAKVGGPSVVIATESTDTAALWIGAATHFMAPLTSRTLGFSVYERASGVGAAVARGALMVGIPHADLDEAAKIDGVIVIDDRQAPEVGDLGGEHHRLGDAVVEVTPWSVMAQVALQSHSLAVLALDQLDSVAAEIGGELELAWPLAMTVALLPEEFFDASAEAFAVLRDASPSRLRSHAGLWAAVSDLAQSQFGTTSAEAWSQVVASAGEAASVVHDLAVDVYNQRVIGDTAWLLRQGGVPAATRGPSEGAEVVADTLVIERLGALRERAEAGEGEEAELLRLADWAIRSGLGVSDDAANEIDRALASGVIAAICDPTRASSLIATVGPIAEKTLAGWVRSLVAQEKAGGGVPSKSSADVIEWLFPDATVPVDSSTGAMDSLAIEWVLHRCDMGDASGRRYRVAALRSLLASNQLVEADRLVLLRAEWPLTSTDAYALEFAYPGSVTASDMEGVLLTAGWDESLALLAEKIERGAGVRPIAHHVRDLAELRRKAAEVDRTHTLEQYEVHPALDLISRVQSHYGPTARVAGVGLIGLVAMCAYAAARRGTFDTNPGNLEFVRVNAQGLGTPTLRSAAESVALSPLFAYSDLSYLASVVARARPGSPIPPLPLWATLAAIPAPERPGGPTFLAMIVDALVPTLGSSLDGVLSEAISDARDECFAISDLKMRDKAVDEFERFARPTWKHLKSLESTERSGRLGAIGRLIRPNDNDKGRP